MTRRNAFYAQAGGVTAVINASACGVIETAKRHRDRIGRVYAGRNGIIGALREELIDTYRESPSTIAALRHTPAAAFGSCRYVLKDIDENPAQYHRLIEVFKAHNIGYFFYNGGNGSANTSLRISQISEKMGYPIQAIHIPKTIDNDLILTDNSPGFGSVAKYVAVSIEEASRDLAAMCETSTKVFILEVMGRNAGWIAAAGGLAARQQGDPPQIILFPEIPFDRDHFIDHVRRNVLKHGFCSIVAAEGIHYRNGTPLTSSLQTDDLSHRQLGGVAPTLASMIKHSLEYRYHWAVADYLQRSARHIASATDVEQSYAVGAAAVEYAIDGENAVMVTIERGKGKRYSWTLGKAPLGKVTNVEKPLPRHFISGDGYGITDSAREYLLPLIQGEDYPPYNNGIPVYARLKLQQVPKKIVAGFET